MSIHQFGIRFICDLCQAIADGPAIPPNTIINYLDQPAPEGWTALGLLTLQDAFGYTITHLCGTCSALSIGQLAAQLEVKHGD